MRSQDQSFPLPPSDITTSPTELSWGEAFVSVFSRPYVIVHLAFIVLATIGLMRRWRRLRYGMLLASLAYLGFYIGGCPCAVGGLQNILLHITQIKLYLIQFVLVGIPLVMSILFGPCLLWLGMPHGGGTAVYLPKRASRKNSSKGCHGSLLW